MFLLLSLNAVVISMHYLTTIFTDPFGNFTYLLIAVVSQQLTAEYELKTGTY